MKKFLTALIAFGVVLCGIVTAYAAEPEQDAYFGSDNSVHFTDANDGIGNYTTVLIRKTGTTGANGVVYVDQQASGFSGVVDFMLKEDASDGKYTATFGNSSNQAKTVNFSIGNMSVAGGNTTLTLDRNNKMSIADESVLQEGLYGQEANGTYKKGFVFNATSDEYNKFNRLYLVSADGANCYGYFEIQKELTVTGGEVAYGIQIYNIPEDKKGMNLYLGEASE